MSLPYTPVRIESYPVQIGYNDRLLTVGSCFADVLGQWLQHRRFQVVANPTGALYYPAAVTSLLRAALEPTGDHKEWEVEHEGVWSDLRLHSKWSHPDLATLRRNRDTMLQDLADSIRQSTWLVLTWGTAFYFRHKALAKPVANCHKLPGFLFDKHLATPDALYHSVHEDFRIIRKHQPHLRILLTVSPVRHIKDGLTSNCLSKATLRILCNQLTDSLSDCYYFPAYELQIDELRDYRFYASDMIHPSETASDWIASKFGESFFSEQTTLWAEQWASFRTALMHKPHFKQTPSFEAWIEHLRNKLLLLSAQFDVEEELTMIEHLSSAP